MEDTLLKMQPLLAQTLSVSHSAEQEQEDLAPHTLSSNPRTISQSHMARGTSAVPPCRNVAPASIPNQRTNKYYAVVRGQEPGVYDTWPEAKCQVVGFSNELYRGFALREDAVDWYWAQVDKGNGVRDFRERDANLTNVDDPAPQVGFLHNPMDDAPTLGPDGSKGRHIHGTSIDVEPDILNILCPRGLSQDAQQ